MNKKIKRKSETVLINELHVHTSRKIGEEGALNTGKAKVCFKNNICRQNTQQKSCENMNNI